MEIARSVSGSTGCGDLVAEWELDVARRLARKYMANWRLLRDLYEPEDLRQDVLIRWICVRDRYQTGCADPPRALMWRVGANRILQIIRSHNTDQRRLQHLAHLFSAPASPATEELGKVQDLADQAALAGDESTSFDIRSALERLQSELTDRDQKILALLAEGIPKTQIARKIGVNRDTVRTDLLRVRKLFEANGLRDFLS